MKRIALAVAGLTACAALSGCGSLSALTQSGGVGEKILTNLEGCHREYSGALGAGVTGSFRIICDPAPIQPAPPPGGT
jgi:hypothetical protein